MLIISKVLTTLCLLCLCRQKKHPGNFQNKSVKLSFQLSVQAYSLLGQTEEERKAFFRGYKKGGRIVRLPARAFGCHKRGKSLSFCEI